MRIERISHGGPGCGMFRAGAIQLDRSSETPIMISSASDNCRRREPRREYGHVARAVNYLLTYPSAAESVRASTLTMLIAPSLL